MDIQKEKIAHEKHPLSQGVDFKYLPNIQYSELENVYELIEWDEEYSEALNEINSSWCTWQAAKAQAVPEWISVEDKLPTENGNYLVCIDGDVFYLTAKWVKNHFKFLARGYGLTEDFTDWRYCEGVKVTHWMTLPAAPQEPTND